MFCDHIQQMVCCLHKPNIQEPPTLPLFHPGWLFAYIFTLYKQFYRIQSFLVLSFSGQYSLHQCFQSEVLLTALSCCFPSHLFCVAVKLLYHGWDQVKAPAEDSFAVVSLLLVDNPCRQLWQMLSELLMLESEFYCLPTSTGNLTLTKAADFLCLQVKKSGANYVLLLQPVTLADSVTSVCSLAH